MTETTLKKLKRLKKAGDFSVRQMCEMLDISRSVYYRTINEQELTGESE